MKKGVFFSCFLIIILTGLCLASDSGPISIWPEEPGGRMDMGQDFFNVHRFGPNSRSGTGSRVNSKLGHTYSELFENNVEIRMVWAPSGSFWMGLSNEKSGGGNDWLRPVKLSRSFYIQQTEMTRSQWDQIARAHDFNPDTSANINWYDTILFCNKISQMKGLDPCYYSDPDFTRVFTPENALQSQTVYWKDTANGYRLPTEAEWLYAEKMAGESDAQFNTEQLTSPKWEWCWDRTDSNDSRILQKPGIQEDGMTEIIPSNNRTTKTPAGSTDNVSFRLVRFAE